MKKVYIIFTSLFLLLFIIIGAKAGLLKDSSKLDPTETGGQTQAFVNSAGFQTSTDIGGIIATAITAFLSLLGIVFIVLLVMAGYKYMTARGDEAKIEEALGTIRRAIIGLIIVAAAYSITYFVFSNLGGNSEPTMMGS